MIAFWRSWRHGAGLLVVFLDEMGIGATLLRAGTGHCMIYLVLVENRYSSLIFIESSGPPSPRTMRDLLKQLLVSRYGVQ